MVCRISFPQCRFSRPRLLGDISVTEVRRCERYKDKSGLSYFRWAPKNFLKHLFLSADYRNPSTNDALTATALKQGFTQARHFHAAGNDLINGIAPMAETAVHLQ